MTGPGAPRQRVAGLLFVMCVNGMFVVLRTTPGVGSHRILIAGHQMVQEKIAQSYAALRRAAHPGLARGYRPHEGYWPTEDIPAKQGKARRRMRPVLDARPDLARAAKSYAARRSAVARMGIAVLCRADA